MSHVTPCLFDVFDDLGDMFLAHQAEVTCNSASHLEALKSHVCGPNQSVEPVISGHVATARTVILIVLQILHSAHAGFTESQHHHHEECASETWWSTALHPGKAPNLPSACPVHQTWSLHIEIIRNLQTPTGPYRPLPLHWSKRELCTCPGWWASL